MDDNKEHYIKIDSEDYKKMNERNSQVNTNYNENIAYYNSNAYMNPGVNPGMNPSMNPGMNPGMNQGMNYNMNPGMIQNVNPNVNPATNQYAIYNAYNKGQNVYANNYQYGQFPTYGNRNKLPGYQFSTASMVCGAMGIFASFSCYGVFGIILGFFSIIMHIFAGIKNKNIEENTPISGLVCGVLALMLSLICCIISFYMDLPFDSVMFEAQ